MDDSIKIRPLKNSDMFTVVGLLKKSIKISGSRLKEIFTSSMSAPSGPESQDAGLDSGRSIELGIMVLTELYDTVVEDLQSWFASLVGKSLDEYMELSPQTTLDIIEQLITGEDSKRFFSRALQLSNQMKELKALKPKE